MRSLLFIAATAIIAVACNAQPQVNSVTPANKHDSASYAIGVNMAKNFLQQNVPISSEMLAAGLRDGLADKALLTDEQIQASLQALQMELAAKQNEKHAKDGAANMAKAEKFLAENKAKPGVMTTPSGLQYKVVKEGTGKKPTAANTVRVHYTGTLIDGKKFDSSVDRGQPAEFGLNGVIAGWTEGLQLMPVGSKYIFYLPPSLAYGESGAGESIGPNEALVFEVELLDIVK